MLFLALLVPSFATQAAPIVADRTIVILPRAERSGSVEEIVRLSQEKPKEFESDWIVYRSESTGKVLVVSKFVMDIGFLESVLADLREGTRSRAGRVVIVRWSERTARFAKEGGTSTFAYPIRRSAQAGLPMVLFSSVVALTDAEPAERIAIREDRIDRQVYQVLDGFASQMRSVEPEKGDLDMVLGYSIVLPSRMSTVEEELSQFRFAQEALAVVVKEERRKWYEGIRPTMEELIQGMGWNESLPRGFVPISTQPQDIRDEIEGSLRLRAESTGQTFALNPEMRVRYIVGVGAIVPLPSVNNTPLTQTVWFPYRD